MTTRSRGSLRRLAWLRVDGEDEERYRYLLDMLVICLNLEDTVLRGVRGKAIYSNIQERTLDWDDGTMADGDGGAARSMWRADRAEQDDGCWASGALISARPTAQAGKRILV